MREFRFRAAAALELRRQQENAAGEALARAEARFREAQAACEAARTSRRQAQAVAVAEAQRGTSAVAIEWHRNWIIRLAATVERLRGEVEKQAGVVRNAENEWREARRRRLALERMKDRAWRRFEQEQRRHELKVIDELARLRYTMSDAHSERNES